MMQRYRRGTRKRVMGDILLTPLIDTALTLLIIFMLSSPTMYNAIKINVPKGQTKVDERLANDIIVLVDEQQKIYFKQKLVDIDDLTELISKEIKNYKHGTVHIHADSSIRYGHVVMIMDRLKTITGVQYIMLAIQKM